VLLVLMVPRIVPPRYIPTALGAHKSIESAGSTISVTLAGMVLDRAVLVRKPAHEESLRSSPASSFVSAASALLKSGSESGSGSDRNKVILATPAQKQAAWNILAGFFFVNSLSICVILLVWRLDRRRKALAAREVGDAAAAAGVDAEAAPATNGEYSPIAGEDDYEGVEENKVVETFATDDDENDDDDDDRGEVYDSYQTTSYDMEPSTSASHAAANEAAAAQTQRRRSSSITPLICQDNSHSQSQLRHSRLTSAPEVAGAHGRPQSMISRASGAGDRGTTANILDHALTPSKGAIRRGKICFAICAAVIFGAWTFYVTTLARDVSRRRHKED
jgi:hypothetical protein